MFIWQKGDCLNINFNGNKPCEAAMFKLHKDDDEIIMEAGTLVISSESAIVESELQAAIDNAQDGDTIILAADISEQVIIKDKSIVIDLCGNTLSNVNKAAMLVDNATVVIKNGTVKCNSKTSYEAAIGVRTGSHLVISADARVTGPYGIIVIKDAATGGNNCVLDINGVVTGADLGTFGGSVGLGVNGGVQSLTSYPTINIGSTAVITATHGSSGNANSDDAPAIYAAGYANWNIADEAVISGDEALSIKAGKFNINGGSFSACGDFIDPATSYNDGTEATGATVSVTYNKAYAGNVELNIHGGEFSSVYGYNLYESDTKSNEGNAISSIEVTNGIFNGGEAAVYSKHEVNFIKGGTYSSDVAEYVAEGYESVLAEDGFYDVIQK